MQSPKKESLIHKELNLVGCEEIWHYLDEHILELYEDPLSLQSISPNYTRNSILREHET